MDRRNKVGKKKGLQVESGGKCDFSTTNHPKEDIGLNDNQPEMVGVVQVSFVFRDDPNPFFNCARMLVFDW